MEKNKIILKQNNKTQIEDFPKNKGKNYKKNCENLSVRMVINKWDGMVNLMQKLKMN